MTATNLQLRPNQAAAITALQRIEAALLIEAEQLDKLWGVQSMAKVLLDARHMLHKKGDEFLRDAGRLIQVAQEVPPIIPGVVTP